MEDCKKITLISNIINNFDINKRRLLINFLFLLHNYTFSLKSNFKKKNSNPLDSILLKIYEKILDKNLIQENGDNKKTGFRISYAMEIFRLRCSLPLGIGYNWDPNHFFASEEDKITINKIKQLEEIEYKERLEKNSVLVEKIKNAFVEKYEIELIAALINCIIVEVELYNDEVRYQSLWKKNYKIKEFEEIITLSPKLLKCYNSKNNIEHLKFLEAYPLISKNCNQ